jgi:hypothetical protein
MFAVFLNSIIVACPGCSFQGTRLRLQYPEDVAWAWLIVIMAAGTIPLLTLCGMRFSRQRQRSSKKQITILTTTLVLIYFLSFSNTFSGLILSWLFFPLNIIQMILLGISWNAGFIAVLVIPLQIGSIPLYMYVMVKIMQRFDRKLYWKSGKAWQRLKGISCMGAAPGIN